MNIHNHHFISRMMSTAGNKPNIGTNNSNTFSNRGLSVYVT